MKIKNIIEELFNEDEAFVFFCATELVHEFNKILIEKIPEEKIIKISPQKLKRILFLIPTGLMGNCIYKLQKMFGFDRELLIEEFKKQTDQWVKFDDLQKRNTKFYDEIH